MIINYSFKNRILKIYFNIETDYEDKLYIYREKNKKKIHLTRPYCSYLLPFNFNEEDINTDAIALTSILLLYPFIGRRVSYGFSITENMKDAITKLGLDCLTVEIKKPNISSNKPTFPGIVYSGGIQSTASLLLLHKTSKLIYLDTIEQFSYIENKDLIEGRIDNKDHIYYTLEHLIKEGYDVSIVRTDIKQMFTPTILPFELAVGTPAILLSSYLSLDSIHYGYTRHHIQQLKKPIPFICTGEWKFCSKYFTPRNPSQKFQSYSIWNKLFKASQLHFSLPVMGCTAVLTHRILNKSKLPISIISCRKGSVKKGCKKCVSCFIQIILNELQTNKIIDSHILDDLYTSMKTIISQSEYNTTLNELFKIPELEIFILYMAFTYKGPDSIMTEWKESLYDYKNTVSKIMQWSTQSVCYIHPKYRDIVRNNIIKYSK